MQELFSQLEIEHPNLFNLHSLDGRKFINDYYKFLELEKQQIIDAFEQGEYTGRGFEDVTSEEYYNINFKSE